jgi:5-oxoprolinase (ATP-hydrolysing) subunit A
MKLTLDLNCDMGESFGAWKMGNDHAIMPYVTSANIACGYHGGDAGVMRETVACALEHGVAIGAHPGLPDLQGFGRRLMQLTEQEAYDIVVAQIGTLSGVAASQGTRLNHVKAHGMLYNMAVKNETLARGIARAVHDVDKTLIFFGLPGSELLKQGQALGLKTASEVFGDRSYQADGSLTPRNKPGAMITDANEAISQVLRMVKDGVVIAQDDSPVQVKADTLCLHGDQPDAVEFAKAIRLALRDAGIAVQAISRSSS